MDLTATKIGGAKILLVEDNEADVILTRKAFEVAEIKHTIMVASTAEEALGILKREGEYAIYPMPHVILLDLNLPKMNGKDLLAIIKGDKALNHIPVIVLTESHSQADIIKSYDLAAHSYMVKPVNVNQHEFLKRLLQQHVQG